MPTVSTPIIVRLTKLIELLKHKLVRLRTKNSRDNNNNNKHDNNNNNSNRKNLNLNTTLSPLDGTLVPATTTTTKTTTVAFVNCDHNNCEGDLVANCSCACHSYEESDDHDDFLGSFEILSHFDADPLNIFIDKNPQDDLNLPEFINGPSVILTPQHVIKLMTALPVNMSVGYNWTLVFSTSRHGFSLSQLYREMREMDPNLPVVLCLTDRDQNVFGAYLSTTIKMSENFYGSGSTFLYTFYPEFKHFHWEGDNFYFMNGAKDSFAVGSGEGLFGLWLDGDLDKGRSHRCTTFHNDILTPDEDFHIVHVEAWQLTEAVDDVREYTSEQKIHHHSPIHFLVESMSPQR